MSESPIMYFNAPSFQPFRPVAARFLRLSATALGCGLFVFALAGATHSVQAADKPASSSNPVASGGDVPFKTLAELGESLFFDTNISKNRTQACATCHDPATAFRDPRGTNANGSFSLGDDGASFGDRNAPMAAYASLSPEFHITKDGIPVGGQFWDGRAKDLAAQAGGPPLNPAEMGMPSAHDVVDRLKEDPDYVEAFKVLFDQNIWDDDDAAFQAMTQAIAAFEKTDQFTPFDSKYDRWLRGEYKMTPAEELGRVLFFSQQFTNCNQCHQLKASGAEGETFTNYQYHNIGVPQNRAQREADGSDPNFVDNGLLDNPAINDPSFKGKYKVPSLRNVAVTGPYMHNGVFHDLKTVIRFYNKYNSRSNAAKINNETHKPWAAPEVPETISLTELEKGDALDTRRVNALVAFLKTLTDKRYEPLLKAQEEAAKAEKAEKQQQQETAQN
ncbi:cytochrome-c peroxidase [Thalassospira sp. TSL5-1]|uniref:cytochrome-c peroxidase n=1 Tax=Thalassospira sp. TSL5-1 TaxID=1544451 RepID=UPI00208E6827|nr:cytochrome c peroxidase [Thalassospira sp. TSL5-1]